MMRKHYVLGVFLVLAACVSTSITSFTDPAFQGRVITDGIVVYASGMPLDERISSETILAERLELKGIRAVRAMDIIPPTRAHTNAELSAEIVKRGATTVLQISLSEKGTVSSYIPQTTIPGQTTGTITSYGNTAILNTQTTPSTTYGGFSVNKPTARYDAWLIDVPTATNIWRAEADLGGSAFDSYESLNSEVANKIIKQLIDDGLITPEPDS